MTPITRILCPVDLSDCSRQALGYAVAIARHYGAALAALLVVPPATPLIHAADLGPSPLFAFTSEDVAQLQADVEQFVKQSAGDLPFAVHVVEGNVVAEIVWRASTADLVVMGTHGRSGLGHLMLGSVTERVLTKTRKAVLTVPPRAPAGLPVELFRRILCGVAFSPASEKALEAAAALANDLGARLNVAHVLERFPIYEPVMTGGPGTPEYDRIASEVARMRLRDSIPDRVRALGPVQEVVREGKAYREILRLAEEEHADLIVLGAHGSGGGLHVFGSTTNQVVRRAMCPVLTVRG
jgi:nucleotide-binding universal stress UspA family protein